VYDFFGDNKLRTFYIFKINREFKTITYKKPYNLFLALNNIHNMDTSDIHLATKLFSEICDETDTKKMNLSVFNKLKHSDSYTKFNNNHLINNYFTTENSKLTINRTHLKLKSTINDPSFFDILKHIPNLFVIDFKSKDYFWLS